MMRKEFKRLTMIVLSLVMMATAMCVSTTTSEAAETVYYDKSYNIQEFWPEKKAPVKE